jgi:hypothetical protein
MEVRRRRQTKLSWGLLSELQKCTAVGDLNGFGGCVCQLAIPMDWQRHRLASARHVNKNLKIVIMIWSNQIVAGD